MLKIIASVNDMVWGAPALVLILGVGMYLTVRLRAVQICLFPEAFRLFVKQILPGKGSSSFRALCTALAATVGTGNLVGVAGAICLGGPGAVFWMWVCGLLGMVTKYTEALLAVRWRVKTDTGFAGGPMYIIRQALPGKFHGLACGYAAFGLLASFGVGNATQINAALTGIRQACRAYRVELSPLSNLLITAILAGIIGLLLFGGAKAIGKAAEGLIPFAAAGYILLCLGVLGIHWRELPGAFVMIFRGAFSPRAVTGGLIGSAFRTLRVGCSRGVFTNEAGMGTASIAHAEADSVHPARQGLMGIMEVFLDTVVICTMTALVILTGGVEIPYGTEAGAELTARALSAGLGRWVPGFLCACLCLFAVATILGWGLYAGRCAEFLLGGMNWKCFALCQGAAVILGSVLDTGIVWTLSELMNALMAVPNLITLFFLLPELRRLTIDYKLRGLRAVGGTYENFHQRKPL